MTALRKIVRDACLDALAVGPDLPLVPELRAENEAANWVRHKAQSRPLVLVMGSQTRRRRVDRTRWQPEVDIAVVIFAPANRSDRDSLDALDDLADAVETRLLEAKPAGFSAVEEVEGDPFDPSAVQGAKTYAHAITITYRKGSL